MGSGTWTRDTFCSYSTTKGMSVTEDGLISGNYSSQEMFKQKGVHPDLNPKNIMRECVDTEEHPNTVPVILALDVTGSMGGAAVEVAKKLNVVMTELYGMVKDVEFCIMGIGDLSYDMAPIQMSQFESDIRIAEHMDKVFFEYGGGGNNFESYTAAWYMGARHTNLDCWKRGKKGIIITIGDELLNPYLPIEGSRGFWGNVGTGLASVTGDSIQGKIETKDLYNEVKDKYDVFHLDVQHGQRSLSSKRVDSFADVIGTENVRETNLDNIADAIVDIITSCAEGSASITSNDNVMTDESGAIIW